MGTSFPCEFCRLVYSSADDLKTHHKSHQTGPEEYHCEVCQTQFDNFESLKHHMRQAHGPQFKHLCFDCGRAFKSYDSINNHRRLFHRPGLICPICDICGKIFPFESFLQSHYKRHVGVKEFKCGNCGKLFKYKQSFKGHICGKEIMNFIWATNVCMLRHLFCYLYRHCILWEFDRCWLLDEQIFSECAWKSSFYCESVNCTTLHLAQYLLCYRHQISFKSISSGLLHNALAVFNIDKFWGYVGTLVIHVSTN